MYRKRPLPLRYEIRGHPRSDVYDQVNQSINYHDFGGWLTNPPTPSFLFSKRKRKNPEHSILHTPQIPSETMAKRAAPGPCDGGNRCTNATINLRRSIATIADVDPGHGTLELELELCCDCCSDAVLRYLCRVRSTEYTQDTPPLLPYSER